MSDEDGESACNCTAPDAAGAGGSDDVVELKILTVEYMKPQLERFWVKNFVAKKRGKVRIEVVAKPGFKDLFEEIETDARLKLGVFDVITTPPVMLGTVARLDGFADMTEYIQSNYLQEWLDIFVGYRDIISSYEGRVYMMPLDGDVLHTFYNKEILSHFNLSPPRTWDEYIAVAKAVHGKTLNGTELVGSCIGRMPSCAGAYWATLALSSITQAMGPSQGSLFDTKNMKPLLGEALLEVLRMFEEQVKYGAPDELEGCIQHVNNVDMGNGVCALTVNWGNSFKRHLVAPAPMRGKLGIAMTPGSTKVLDRKSGKLVECNRERCPYAFYYEDLGLVNHAPYAAFGGWSGAVSANIMEKKKTLAMEFLAFAASREESSKVIIPNATNPDEMTGFDPFRQSHLDVDEFVAQGYGREVTEEYRAAILENLQSPNLVTDIRFPTAGAILNVLDHQIFYHLNRTKGETNEEVIAESRTNVLETVTAEWTNIIDEYNRRGDTDAPLLEQYQRLRNVYTSENENLNQLGNIRAFGFVLAGVIIILSVAFTVWVIRFRTQRVVRVSQPLFLIVLNMGVLVLGSAIFPLGIDDSLVDQAGCDRACMAFPWLLSSGFTIMFSALFSKIWRVNKIFHTARFQRITVREKDVAVPFAVLFSLNVILLVAWTIVDPLKWERVYEDELNSYGVCAAEGDAWKGFLSAVAAINAGALILANVQAYIARNIKDEFSESKWIGIAMASMLQMALVGTPLLALVYDNPNARFFVWTGIIFVVCTSLLLLIFVPKIILKRESDRKSNEVVGVIPVTNAAAGGLPVSSGSSGTKSFNSSSKSSLGMSFGPKLTGTTLKALRPVAPLANPAFADKQSEQRYTDMLDELVERVSREHGLDLGPTLKQVGLSEDGSSSERSTDKFVVDNVEPIPEEEEK